MLESVCIFSYNISVTFNFVDDKSYIIPLYIDIFFLRLVLNFFPASLCLRSLLSFTLPGVAPAYCAIPQAVFFVTVISSTSISMSSTSDSSTGFAISRWCSCCRSYWRESNPEAVDFMLLAICMPENRNTSIYAQRLERNLGKKQLLSIRQSMTA